MTRNRSPIALLILATALTACEPGTRETVPDGIDATPAPGSADSDAPEDVVPPASGMSTQGVAQGGVAATGRSSADTGATEAFSDDPQPPAPGAEVAPPVPPAGNE